MVKITAVSAALILVFAAGGSAQAAKAQAKPGKNLCAFMAYSVDADAKGTNVRSAPNATASVVTTLPPVKDEGGTKLGVEFDVIGGSNGWFQIQNAVYPTVLEAKKETSFPKADNGWITANLARVEIAGHELKARPQHDAPAVFKLAGETTIEKIFGCSGSYVDMAIKTSDGKKARGWLTGTCKSQLTTCDSGDVYETEEKNGKLIQRDE